MPTQNAPQRTTTSSPRTAPIRHDVRDRVHDLVSVFHLCYAPAMRQGLDGSAQDQQMAHPAERQRFRRLKRIDAQPPARPGPSGSHILFATYLQGYSLQEWIEDDAEKLDIPIHGFGLIIADECHRVYSAKELSVWRKTLNYFDAIKIGLTATPAAHTLAEFERVVFRYEYERAVREDHLVDYDPVRVSSYVRINGVFLQEGDQVNNVDPETGSRQIDVLEDERTYAAWDIERKVTVPASNRRILDEIKRYAYAHEQRYGRFPKTLIFADNDLQHTSHADQLVEEARAIFGRGENFVAKITGKVDRPLRRIREFRNRPNPGIA